MRYLEEDHRNDAFDRRSEDHWKEICLSDFLDKNFYKKLNISAEKITDKETQIRGVDKKFRYNNYSYRCDEKGATSEKYFKNNPNYRPLNTFCMECYQIPRFKNDYVYGWFLNVDSDTNSYLLTWIDEANLGHWNSDEDIKEVECILVKKDNIFELLKQKGIDLKVITETCKNLMNSNNKFTFINGIKFNKLFNYSENPINIQLTREDYRSIADVNIRLKRAKDNKVYLVKEKLNKGN